MNEYQYLRWLAFCEYEAEITAILRWAKEEKAKLKDDFRQMELLEMKRESLMYQAFAKRVRSEDIICWLMLDTLLREDGFNYSNKYMQISHFAPNFKRWNES